jgi:hypothetical protein
VVICTENLHRRLLHVPVVSENAVQHLAHDYRGALELARNGEGANRNSDSLQYFALEVYGTRVAAPGVGCVGELNEAVAAAPSNQTIAAAPSNQTIAAAPSNQTIAAAPSNLTIASAATNLTIAAVASNTTVHSPSLSIAASGEVLYRP